MPSFRLSFSRSRSASPVPSFRSSEATGILNNAENHSTSALLPYTDLDRESPQSKIVDVFTTAFRKSLIICGGVCEYSESGVRPSMMLSPMDIGDPTDVKHVAHVTFDRFDGFLGLSGDLETDILKKVPSASASIFGVSPSSLHCSYDSRGNSVPSILLLMQRRLYFEGGLLVEGIFRINADNSQEESIRRHLNSGVIPHEMDMHSLSGLIKAWFRELPTGLLDTISPDQMIHCNSEEECSRLVKMIPSMEASLLDWAVNLMADVVEHEHQNKMNAHNIAMVFAPNMTQTADPLTALIYAVQVMNFLKTLIEMALRERKNEPLSSNAKELPVLKRQTLGGFFSRAEIVLESNIDTSFQIFEQNSDTSMNFELSSGKCSPLGVFDDVHGDEANIGHDRIAAESFRRKQTLPRSKKKPCVFSMRKISGLAFGGHREGREACAS